MVTSVLFSLVLFSGLDHPDPKLRLNTDGRNIYEKTFSETEELQPWVVKTEMTMEMLKEIQDHRLRASLIGREVE